MVFLSVTEDWGFDEKKRIAKRTAIFGCLVLLIFAIFGDFILSFFRITVDSLRVVGGILLLAIAMDMMHRRKSRVYIYTGRGERVQRKGGYILLSTCSPDAGWSRCDNDCDRPDENRRLDII
jgi:small neutral amino acid transporter SnatA (MarC family)